MDGNRRKNSGQPIDNQYGLVRELAIYRGAPTHWPRHENWDNACARFVSKSSALSHFETLSSTIAHIACYRVTQRLDKGGMSLSEFCYPMMQAWDWWHLYRNQDIQVQIGGSDQFGNILAGMDAVNYVRRNHHDPQLRDNEEQLRSLHRKPMGFTVPLLTNSAGQKFGKSAGNAISLDKDLTTPFDLYQVGRSLYFRKGSCDVNRVPVFSADC